MMGATSSATLPEAPRGGESVKQLLAGRTLRMVLVLLALWAVLGVHPETRGAFLSAQNFSNLTAQIAEIVIIGAGMTMVILIRGIDLSVGAGMALTGVIAAKLQIDHHQPAWVAILAAVAVSTVIGIWHGVLVSRFQVPAFIATLGGFLAYRGIGLVVSESRGLSPMSPDFARLGSRLPPTASMIVVALGLAIGLGLIAHVERRRKALNLAPRGASGVGLRGLAVLAVSAFFAVIYKNGMPVPALIAAVTTALCALVLGWTRTGRYAFAIGGNAEAARLSGVPVARVTIVVYLLTGVLTAVAGMVMAARTNGVTPGNAGLMKELHVITAVVIGGTSLTGGRATIAGTVIGALVFGTLSNGMNLMNVNSNWQLILTGAILLAASLLDSWSNKKRHA
jgi:D-xylose transport system permease protein